MNKIVQSHLWVKGSPRLRNGRNSGQHMITGYVFPLIIVASLLGSGCQSISLPKPNVAAEPDELDSMLGSNQAAVEQRLGCPRWELRDAENSWYIYETRERSTRSGMWFYTPAAWESAESMRNCDYCGSMFDDDGAEGLEVFHCVVLEFDRGEVLRSHKTRTDLPAHNTVETDCRRVFWNIEQLIAMNETRLCIQPK